MAYHLAILDSDQREERYVAPPERLN